MYHGNIFQNAPTCPFAERKDQVGTWGVETEYENVFLCGSSALRGGAVSGIPGHNAAMKVLELCRKTFPMAESSTSQAADPRDVESIDAIIAAAYDVISGPAGQKRDWNRERSLYYPGARIMPTASVPGRNDVDLEPQMLDVEEYIARVRTVLQRRAFTKGKSRGAPNSLAGSLTFGAHTNRVTI